MTSADGRERGGGEGRAELAARLTAGEVVRGCRRELAQRGATVLSEATGGGAVAAWRHYPEGEAYDPASHAQYFYHQHADGEPDGEHGHFHTFLRAEGMPDGVAPLLLPELAVADASVPPQAAPLRRGNRLEVSHLVAIAIDGRGDPVRLFTTNRWVTGETWYRADDVARMLERFAVAGAQPSLVLNRWVGAVVGLFRPRIAALLGARDEAVMQWRRRRRGHVFDDHRLEITSSVAIDVEAEIAALERLAAAAEAPAAPPPLRLPRLAEGWGDDAR